MIILLMAMTLLAVSCGDKENVSIDTQNFAGMWKSERFGDNNGTWYELNVTPNIEVFHFAQFYDTQATWFFTIESTSLEGSNLKFKGVKDHGEPWGVSVVEGVCTLTSKTTMNVKIGTATYKFNKL